MKWKDLIKETQKAEEGITKRLCISFLEQVNGNPIILESCTVILVIVEIKRLID